MAGGAAEFTITPIDIPDVDVALEFYAAHPDHHLWPRTRGEIESFARAQALYVAHRGKGRIAAASDIVGACYLKAFGPDDVPAREQELGGIFVLPELQGNGIAKALTSATMAIVVAQSEDRLTPIIAHVHELNDAPRGLLGKLGFVRNPAKDEIVPPNIAPASMRRNADGHVVGHLFEFQRERLRDLAGWVAQPLDPRFRCPLLTGSADAIAATLRVFAEGDP